VSGRSTATSPLPTLLLLPPAAALELPELLELLELLLEDPQPATASAVTATVSALSAQLLVVLDNSPPLVFCVAAD
jgi:hypothetical protein